MTTKLIENFSRVCWLLIVVLAAQPAWSQIPAPASLPNVNLAKGGEVYAVAVQPDGGVVFGGLFTAVNGTPRSNIARLLPDGALDPNWDAVVSDSVLALAVDNAGHVYVGGSFQSVDTTSRRYVARLDRASGEVDASWNPSANNTVRAIAVDNIGGVFVGGDFSEMHSAYYDRVVKIAAVGDGSPDTTWAGRSYAPVRALAVDNLGSVYAAGSFVAGDGLRELVKLSALTGAADATWNPPNFGLTMSITISSNHVYVGTQSSVAKVAANGAVTAAAVWETGFNGNVRAVAAAAGHVYAGGTFTETDGQPSPYLARLFDSDGTLDESWSPLSDSYVHTLAMGDGGRLFVGGVFTQIGSSYRLGLAALMPSGSPGPMTDVEQVARVNALVEQSDGGIVAGGDFLKAGGSSRRHVLRLKSDGAIDPEWAPATNGEVRALALGDDDTIYVGGDFSAVNGLHRSHLVKLAGSGSGEVDARWAPDVDGNVYALAYGSDQSVFVGGLFGRFGLVQRRNIAKISADGAGAVDAGWQAAGANGVVLALARDGDAIYAGGGFTSVDGQSHQRIAKLAAAGSGANDPNWTAGASDQVQAIVVGADGSMFVGGRFTNVNGANRYGVAKLAAATGMLDLTWQPGFYNGFPFAVDRVMSLALAPDASLFVGGFFYNVNGQYCRNLAKVASTGAGALAANWCPDIDGEIGALVATANDTLYAAGRFQTVSGLPRASLVAFKPERIFANGME